MFPRSIGSSTDAIQAVSRLVAATSGAGGDASALDRTLVREARALFEASGAILVAIDARHRQARVLATDPDAQTPAAVLDVDAFPALRELVDRRGVHAQLDAPQIGRLARGAGLPLGAAARKAGPQTAVAFPMRSSELLDHVLILVPGPGPELSPAELDVAAAFAAAAGATLAQVRLAEEQTSHIAQQAALARAAKTLNESLDLSEVLSRISREAQALLAADHAVVYRGNATDGLVIATAHGLGPDAAGWLMPVGEGLSGRVVQTGRAMLTNDYQRIAAPAPESPFADVLSAISVPMRWDGELHGVLSVGYNHPRPVSGADLGMLEMFAELAAVACRNANAAAGLALAARTDGLTGCLNHAAFQEGLRREIERAQRTRQEVSLVLFDLDDFKQVNEAQGHLVGDEVLRRVGHALRIATRPYDLVARYGGDEFVILTPDADEEDAAEIAQRALERVARALNDVGKTSIPTWATAGVAQWVPGQTPTELIEQADRALLFGKQEGRRGSVMCSSELPQLFRPGRFRRPNRPTAAAEPEGTTARLSSAAGTEAERLQKRTRQLHLANALGTRLAGLTDAQEIIDAAVEEVHRALGYFMCTVMALRDDDRIEVAAGRGVPFGPLASRGWSQPRGDGVVGRCLRERALTLVNDVHADSDFIRTEWTTEVRSEIVVPVWVGDVLWGALNVEEVAAGAFDEDDARLLQTVADQLGSALCSALLYERLERAYLGTAQALAAALEAKDSYTAQHARLIAEWAEAVGRRLGMTDAELTDLRYGAVFHDIGKISVPEAILNKRGPLTADERAVIERHTVVGEQILAPVEFLASVRPLVRHEHERWDGAGYPDGLAGPAIPLGARIVFVCDAFHAMTSDRPYRAAMTEDDARTELRRAAGSQFDPAVVDAFLAVVGDGAAAA